VLDDILVLSSYYMSPDNDQIPADMEEKIHETAKKAIAERSGAEEDAETVVLSGHPGRTITDYAEKSGADCMIVAYHNPEVNDFFLGSTAARGMRYAPCAVHVLR
ncbi:MAG: universal stress protein, partial [Gammaproteobacteria bacterium]|nr:universal stress protein [Gammaproteobacteria bacterium]